MINSIRLTVLYICFALIATLFNILAQQISTYIYDGSFYIIYAMLIGTFLGLVIKYILDKTFIFQYKTRNLQHNTRLFILYLIAGILTTFIFFGAELLFYYLFEDKEMRYVGGIIGLMIGYICKYYLDKKFVFKV
ncbi:MULTISPECIES: GtrA family protein [unclassified Acinetobacter]|uniref:GtrA family protein n=1 Tax=unclassified Acinetobacter TaxID=196816 RepID=UPI00293432A7|nr:MULTISPECIES: GtrA family protein [unclassified Acinetobacter]WOE31303.1 GtrA family protein [Acinetobacter sp. SAAs470]WOE39499.1 GtrA family protein [Acinetobacter sp. SAAs474]